MLGLWHETFDRCDFDLAHARQIEHYDPKRAIELTERALADYEIVLNWITMALLLEDAQRAAREIR